MSEKDFWRSTPRKVGALWKLHIKFNHWEEENEEENKQEKRLNIDEVPFL